MNDPIKLIKHICRVGTITLVVVTMFFGGLIMSFGSTTFATGPDKVTICHASGKAGTTKFETLTLPTNAVYGQAGHFYENGTKKAGHEEDYVGSCKTASPTPKPSVSPKPSHSPTPKPSWSPSPTPSVTPRPSVTPKPSHTPTPSPTPSPTPTPTPSPTSVVSPSPTPCTSCGGNHNVTNENNNSNNQEQHQEQNNNQTVNITVYGGTSGSTLGTKITKSPETGVSVLGLTSMFGAGPVGYALSRFGRGKINSKRDDEESMSEIALGLVNGRGNKKA